jgi:hypothetical protein
VERVKFGKKMKKEQHRNNDAYKNYRMRFKHPCMNYRVVGAFHIAPKDFFVVSDNFGQY